MFTLSGLQPDNDIYQPQKRKWPWNKPTCACCNKPLKAQTLIIARHTARELLQMGLLNGEAERAFQSTRDDLGWHLRGWSCAHCQKIAITELRHQR